MSSMRAAVATSQRQLLLVAIVVRLIPAVLIYGSDDVTGWETIGRAIVEGRNAYTTKYAIVWPPLWLPLTALAQLIAEMSRLPFQLVIKLFPIAADIVIAFVLHHYAPRFNLDANRTAMWWAVNPIAIYTSAIHGQFDSIPALCVLLAVVYAALGKDLRSDRAAAIWLGVGAAFKTWPLFVLPALMGRERTLSRRIFIAGTVVSIFVFCLAAPALFVGVGPIRDAFAYRGFSGWWGISSIGRFASWSVDERTYKVIFDASMIVVAGLLCLSRVSVQRGALLLLLTFYVATPGFGLQYLVWLLPAALLADQARAKIYTIIATFMVAIEALFRPYTGYVGEMFRGLPHAGYAKAYGGEIDIYWTTLGRLPLWAFCVIWWVIVATSALRVDSERMRTRDP